MYDDLCFCYWWQCRIIMCVCYPPVSESPLPLLVVPPSIYVIQNKALSVLNGIQTMNMTLKEQSFIRPVVAHAQCLLTLQG